MRNCDVAYLTVGRRVDASKHESVLISCLFQHAVVILSGLPILGLEFFYLNFLVNVGLYCAGYFDFVLRTLLINLINSVASSNNTVGILRKYFLICHRGFILSVV